MAERIFSQISILGAAGFLRILSPIFLLIFLGKSPQKNPPSGKSPAKSSKISAEGPGQNSIDKAVREKALRTENGICELILHDSNSTCQRTPWGWKEEEGGKLGEGHHSQKQVSDPPSSVTFSPLSGVVALLF